jgi:hypothetical protein
MYEPYSSGSPSASHHVAAGRQVRGEPGRAPLVELGHRPGVPARMVGAAGGHRVLQQLLDHTVGQVRRGDAAGVRAAARPLVVRDDVGGADQPGGLDRDQFGVARA